MNVANELIEMQIMNAVRKLLTEKANELLGSIEYAIPLVEFGNYGGADVVFPGLSISTCELTEKERIIRLSAFTLTISFNVPDSPDSELHSYTYAWAVCRAFEGNATLGGIADRAVVTAKKFVPPKKIDRGQGWEVILTVRVTVEGSTYAG
jgi:hypothetical protein